MYLPSRSQNKLCTVWALRCLRWAAETPVEAQTSTFSPTPLHKATKIFIKWVFPDMASQQLPDNGHLTPAGAQPPAVGQAKYTKCGLKYQKLKQ